MQLSHTLFARPLRFVFCSFLLALIALSVTAPTYAQDLDDATIGGRVTDPNDAVIPGATIVARRVSTGTERTVTSDNEGRYRFIDLEPDGYELAAAAPNFLPFKIVLREVLAGQRIESNIKLELNSSQYVVDVTVDPSPVDTTRTVVGGTVTEIEIESLPSLDRAPLDFVFTLPGVSEEALSTRDAAEDRDRRLASTPEEAGNFSLSGSPAFSNNVTIDGLDNNDDRGARERFQPSLEAIAEVQVITNQFSAEYGRASGGRLNLRTRSGSNHFRGRGFYFGRDESLNANSFFNNARGLKRLPLQQHTPGFTLSGPVVLPSFLPRPLDYDGRNRTFIFAAYEFDTTLDTALTDTLVPVARNPRFALPQPSVPDARRFELLPDDATLAPAELAPFVEQVSTPIRNHAFTLRLDHTFSERHTGNALIQLGRSRNLRQFGGGSRLAESLIGRTRDSDAVSYTDTFLFTPTTINQLRVQASRLTPAVTAAGTRPVVLIDFADALAANDPARRTGTLVAGSSTLGATDRRETRFQIQDAASLVRGAHTFKFGADVQRIRSTFVDLTDASGTFEFASAADFLADTPSRFRQSFGASSALTNTYIGVFAQDEWQLRPNLTASFGVRYERETIIDDGNNLAPRFALAYDPFASGRTVIRAGAGIFFNRALLRTIDDFTLGESRRSFDTNNLRDPTTGATLTPEQRRAFIRANLRFPEVLAADSSLVSRFGVEQTDFARRLDPNLRIPESYQFNVGGEREIGNRLVVEVNYTFNRGLHLWREFNANAPRLPAGFRDFSEFLLSRDFFNFRDATGVRPLYDATSAGELVRFAVAGATGTDPNAILRVNDFGVPVSIFHLDSINSTSAVRAALGALNDFRPDRSRGQIEQLVSAGNSFYHGLTIEMRRRFADLGAGFGASLRAGYTLSRLTDDGVVNTSSALVAGDFAGERAAGLQDRRHRFVFSGVFDTPRGIGGLRFSPILRAATGAPFNISLGGVDRNLDDVSNDRPVFLGETGALRSRAEGDAIDPATLAAFRLPLIGRAGDLPRNAGRGPGFLLLDLSVTREFQISERVRVRPVIEFGNVLNRTSFTFGAEFIDFRQARDAADPGTRAEFLRTFLVPQRALRARTVRYGLRIDF